MKDRVTYCCEDGAATISMDDGKVNVMSVAMMQEIDAALTRAQQDEAIIVLRSARSGIFSAGFDLKIFSANDPRDSLEMVRTGAELALRLMSHPFPTVGLMQGHAFPMGTFLLLGCDVRLGMQGNYRMGLNEVAIGIPPPTFAIELARSRVQPAWLSRTVTLGEMFEPDDALAAGFLDRVVSAEAVEATLHDIVGGLRTINKPAHALAKQRLRRRAMADIREAIDAELTLAAYEANAQKRSSVVLPGGNR